MMADEELSPESGGEEPVQNDVQEPVQNEVPTSSDASDEVSPESLASELGWCPQEEWRGDPADWKPAKDFLKSTVDINKGLRRELKATREASERAARAAAAITEQALEKQRQELIQARQQAFDAGDAQAFSQVENQLRSLPVPQAPAQSSESQDFRQRNATWFGVDPIASQIAYNVCQMHADKGADYATQLAEAEKVIRQRFPEYFRTQAAKGPAQVEAGQSRATATARKGPKGYNDLPQDAKRAADDFAKRGRATKEEYAKLYWEENA
jgi:hypothetical protein